MAFYLRQDLICFTLNKCFFHEEQHVSTIFFEIKKSGKPHNPFQKHFQRIRRLFKYTPRDYLDRVFIQKSCWLWSLARNRKDFVFLWTISESVNQVRDRSKKHFALCTGLRYGQGSACDTPGNFRGDDFIPKEYKQPISIHSSNQIKA